MKRLQSNSFLRLNSFYDQRIEVTLSESIYGFSTKDIYVKQKAMFIISYIYQKAIAKENCSFFRPAMGERKKADTGDSANSHQGL